MMHDKLKIGVYICHCGMNIAPKVDVEAVTQFAQGLDLVDIARNYKFMCSNPGQEMIIEGIKEDDLNRVVVASCSPRMHEITFRQACETAGINPHFFQMANIREQSSWVTDDTVKATSKAKELVAAAVARVAFHKPLKSREVPVKKSVLIIGGGIAGIQAALSASQSGFEVSLVERESSIGGHMSKFDKTFPTLDCAACISTPKTVSIGQSENITLYSYSEVTKIEGFVGNYKASIKRKSRFISEDKCTGCGECEKVCPVEISDSFNEGLSKRKAIYRSFPQAVPLTYCIDKRDTAPCTTTCPAAVNVQGYIQLIGKKEYQKAVELILERIPLPGVLGRVCPHPCENECRRNQVDSSLAIRELKRYAADQVDFENLPVTNTQEKDQKVAVVGSGPAGLTVAYELRKKGLQVTIFESLPVLGGMLRVGIPDYRLPPKVLDEEINHILSSGIQVQTNTTFGTDITIESLKKEGFEAIFLGIGAHDSLKLGLKGEDEIHGVFDALSILKRINLGETIDIGSKTVIVGGGNVAVDAAGIATRLGSDVKIIYRRSREDMPAYNEEIRSVEEEGVYISCFTAPVKIIEENGKLTGIECIKTEPGEADSSGRRRPVPVEGSEFIIECDSLIAAIGQRTDAPWINDQKNLEWQANKTISVDKNSLETSIKGVFAGGDVRKGPATVIEAITDGHVVAASIENYLSGNHVREDPYLKSVDPVNGEKWLETDKDLPKVERASPEWLEASVRSTNFEEISLGFTESKAAVEAEKCLNCGACCECKECVSACEANAIDHDMSEETVEIDTGAIILATGFNAFNPSNLTQFGYGIFPEVYTSLEFERLNNATGPTGGLIQMRNGEVPKRVAIIHCIGSRDSNHLKYCSRVCCMYSMKFAHLVREKTGAEVWEYYIDVRSPGKGYEEFYDRVQEEGVHFIRGKVAEITDIPDKDEDFGRLTVVAENTLLQKPSRISVDMVILSVGIQPSEGSEEVAKMAGVSRDKDGWFNELHAKLAPVSTPISGVFLVGCCQGPKDIPDTVAQAMAAAGEATALLSKGTVKTLTEVSYIDPDLCSGCKTCIDVCPYSAITFSEGLNIAKVNEALCQGCGSCAAACPSSSAGVKHFKDEQVMAEIEALL